MSQGYLLGPGLLSKIHSVIDRVDGITTGSGGQVSQPRFVDGPPPTSKFFRIGTFANGWSKDSTATVTLRGSTATVTAINLFAQIETAASARNCAIARDGTAWYLIAAECA
jgi:hypothetical protein